MPGSASILTWIIVGGVVGWLASIVTGSSRRQGCLLDVIVGVIGAFIGGLVVSRLGGAGVTSLNIYSFLVATLGAVILLSVVNLFRKRGR